MKYSLAIFCILLALVLSFCMLNNSESKVSPIWKIAIIDSGSNITDHLCPGGHYNFDSNTTEVGHDNIGHGSIIHDIIVRNIRHSNYCIMVFKIQYNEIGVAKAISKAAANGADVMNISIQGSVFSFYEYEALQSSSKIRKFVAAGNNGTDMNVVCNTFPACYRGIENMFVVGAVSKNTPLLAGQKSNVGFPVTMWYDGAYKGGFGTSFATARATAAYVDYLTR